MYNFSYKENVDLGQKFGRREGSQATSQTSEFSDKKGKRQEKMLSRTGKYQTRWKIMSKEEKAMKKENNSYQVSNY